MVLSAVGLIALLAAGSSADELESGELPSDRPYSGTVDASYAGLIDVIGAFADEHEIRAVGFALSEGSVTRADVALGWRDRAATRPLTTSNTFRLASVTKPYTKVLADVAVALGYLRLDDKLFCVTAVAANCHIDLTNVTVADPRLADITIQHALDHEGGWDRTATFDPMFSHLRIADEFGLSGVPDIDDIIRYMAGVPLDAEPGSAYLYSNFGYATVGRAIELASGRDYFELLEQQVLGPLGRAEVYAGSTLPPDRPLHEVDYFCSSASAVNVFDPDGPRVCWPDGGFHVESRTSNGGLVGTASAVIEHFELFCANGELNLGNCDRYHTGSLPGTWTVARNLHSHTYAVLMNKRARTSPLDGSNVGYGDLIGIIDSWLTDAASCPRPNGDGFTVPIDHGSSSYDVLPATTVCATGGYGGNASSDGSAPSVWHEWTAPASGSVSVTTCSAATDYDTYLTAFSTAPFELLTTNDDAQFCDDNVLASTIRIPVEAGGTYRFAVEGFQGATGNYELTIDFTPATIHLVGPACPIELMVDGALAGATEDFALLSCGVPSAAQAVFVTIWADNPVAEGNLRLQPAGDESPAGVTNFGASGLENATSLWVPLSAEGELTLGVNGGPLPPGTPLADQVTLEVLAWTDTASSPGLAFHTVNPCAFFDSRSNQGSVVPGPHPPGTHITAQLTGSFPAGQGGGQTSCGVPSSARAALINFTLVQPSGPVRLEDSLSGATLLFNEPLSAPFNNASAVIVPLTTTGRVDVEVLGSLGSDSHVRMQVFGYLSEVGSSPAGLSFVPVAPCVTFDSRYNQGASGQFVGERFGGEITTYQIAGSFSPAQGGGNTNCGVPHDAVAVEMNLVGVNALAEGNLLVAAAGQTPSGGALNFGELDPKMNNANAVVIPLSSTGGIDVHMNGGPHGRWRLIAHVRGTVTGYWISPE